MPTILITGANRGLGLEFVRQYAADKWDVIACVRAPLRAAKLKALAKTNKAIRIMPLNVTEPKSIKALATKLKKEAVDVLVNNAGIISGATKPLRGRSKGGDQDFGSIDGAAWLKVLNTNTVAPIILLETLLPQILRGRQRKIVNITSKMGSISEMGSGYIAYRTSKAALNAAMNNIAADIGIKKISWVNLHPGWVKTDMGGKGADITPETSITGMKNVIQKLNLKNSGQFVSYEGKVIPW